MDFYLESPKLTQMWNHVLLIRPQMRPIRPRTRPQKCDQKKIGRENEREKILFSTIRWRLGILTNFFVRFCDFVQTSLDLSDGHQFIMLLLLLYSYDKLSHQKRSSLSLSLSLSLPLFFFLSLSHIKRDHPSLILTLSLSLSLSRNSSTKQHLFTQSHTKPVPTLTPLSQ